MANTVLGILGSGVHSPKTSKNFPKFQDFKNQRDHLLIPKDLAWVCLLVIFWKFGTLRVFGISRIFGFLEVVEF